MTGGGHREWEHASLPALVAMPTGAQLMGSLADSDDSAYRLSEAYVLLEVNAAFRRFAAENGGASSMERWRHESVLGAVVGPLRAFYAAGYAQARATGAPWAHVYECSSAEQLRAYHMTVYPVVGEFVVVHALRFACAHARPAFAPDVGSYVYEGFITMCSHCRRVKNTSGRKRWDWVPGYVSRPPATVSHGLCASCAEFYWP